LSTSTPQVAQSTFGIRLAYDTKLLSAVLRTFLRVVQGWYRRRGRELGLTTFRGGSVTFAQRFGSVSNSKTITPP